MVRLFLISAAFILAGVASGVAGDCYLKIEGIDGEVKNPDYPGAIEVQSFSWGIISPRDPASGLPTGKRMHKPFVITKELDKASPLLAKALCQGEHFKDVTLFIHLSGGSGQIESYYKVTMQDVMVSSIELTSDDVGEGMLRATEALSFTYQKIEWSHLVSKNESSDSWRQP